MSSEKLKKEYVKLELLHSQLDELIKKLNESSIIAVDTETSSLNPQEADLVGISICYNEKRYVVDANVYRVFSRLFGIKTEIDKPQAYTKFLNTTSSLAKKIKNTGDYNEAIMDFGGSVCLPKKPKCIACVFKLDCFANKNNLVEVLPAKKQKLKITN